MSLFALFLQLSFIFSQDGVIKHETIDDKIKNVTTDSLKLQLLLDELITNRTHYKLDSIISVGKQIIHLSKKSENQNALFEAYNNLGAAYLYKNNIDSSYLYTNKAYEFAKQVNDTLSIAKALIQFNHFHVKNNDLELATTFGIKSVEIAERTTDKSVMADAYNTLSKVFAFYDDNFKYKDYIDKAFRLVKDESTLIDPYITLEIYANMVDYFEHLRYNYPKDQKVIDSLHLYIDEGLILTNTVDYPIVKVQLLGLKGKLLYNADKLNQAEEFYYKALKYKESIPPLSLLNLYHQLAHLYIKKNNIEKGFAYKDIILQDAEKETSLYRKGELYRFAYYISIHAKKIDLAIEYFEKMNHYFNLAKDKKQIEALNELEVKYNTEKKDAEIAKQKLKNETLKHKARTNYFIIGIVAILSLSVLSILYFKKKNKVLITELDLVNTKAKLLRSQINPHFISNSINAIYPFLYDKSDPNKAAAYLSDLSQMIRSILDSTFETHWTIKEELDFIKQYCKIQELKMDIPFELHIDCEEVLFEVNIPSLVTQTFIENAFVHGFTNLIEKAIISIKISEEDSNIKIQINDNGKVIKNHIASHKSRSTDIIKQRIINSYSKYHLAKNFLICRKLATGYEVILKIPNTK
ncbi:histidine kinase [Psychroserpens sp. XS_ASV72]|uniref:histidine kinase n=1 Tax=Psychroserpens sp. XS_ASV72 TaxID=3241293 RepID=UPI0035121D04